MLDKNLVKKLQQGEIESALDRLSPAHIDVGEVLKKMNAVPLASKWRMRASDVAIELVVDVPGIRQQDLRVELQDNVLRAIGNRFDDGSEVVHECTIGAGYDLSSFDAVLEAGVLSIIIMRSHDKSEIIKIPVTVK